MLDLIIVGGGIVGIATALEIQRQCPGLVIRIMDKEPGLARHQTGRNSGVVHAGLYYAPGSLKAELCRQGLAETLRFCQEHGLPLDQCGKLVVATTPTEMVRLQALTERAVQNGLDVRSVSAAELREREPNITGLGAIYSPATAITDYRAIVTRMAELFVQGGGEITPDCAVEDLREGANSVTVVLGTGETVTARHLIACAGLGADRLARMCGLAADFAIVPFKGEYFRLAPRHDAVVRHLIYPVPDPSLPFLGIHLTRMIGGHVTVGPNAVLSLAREGYSRLAMAPRDLAEMARFPGLWRMLAANLRPGLAEMRNSLFRGHYLRACQKYCPSLELHDLLPHPSGIRAQAVLHDGTLVHDFLIRQSARTIHICNAPSPAATSAMPIARHIRQLAATIFALRSNTGR